MSTTLIVFLASFGGGAVVLTSLVLFGGFTDGGDLHNDSDNLHGAAGWLAVRSWCAALTAGGFVGAAVLQTGAGDLVASIAALGGGALGVMGWRRITASLSRFDEDQSPQPYAAIGKESILTASIDGAQKPGVVQLTVGGVTHDYTAYADSPIPAGTPVIVTSLISPHVVAVAPLSSSPLGLTS